MGKYKFSPETDFEESKIDLINMIRNIKREEVPEKFEESLYHKILSNQIYFVKTKNYFKDFMDFISRILDPRKPLSYLLYAGALASVFLVALLFLYKPQSGQPVNEMAQNKYQVMPDSSIAANRSEKPQQNPKTALSKNDTYLIELHKKVSKNLNYGFLNTPSLTDVKKIIGSDKFKERIARYKNSTGDDTVKVIISIFEEQN